MSKNEQPLDWDCLRVFLAVARAGQLFAAARKLRITHSTVGRQISRLEAGLHENLVERMSNGCRLTTAGEQLLPFAERVESAVLQAQSVVSRTDVEVSGNVRIGAPETFGAYFLAPRLPILAKRYPKLDIQLVPLPLNLSLPKREVDIAVMLTMPTEGRLIARKLTDYSLSFYASRSYLSQCQIPKSINDLKSHLFVSYVPDMLYSPSLNYHEIGKVDAGYILECASSLGQLEIVQAGGGVGILHDFAAARHPNLVKILPDVRFLRAYWLIVHTDVHELNRIRKVGAFIFDEVQAQKSQFVDDASGNTKS
ncbi:MAG: LysR family transcriptional regulator [Terracidiphilus sp.]|nr:LysR family transcriptional regulator [Terracidiphilus sp.]MDR3799578.1 LysR family transcriptional regulator [Terracidiphilus sp.]